MFTLTRTSRYQHLDTQPRSRQVVCDSSMNSMITGHEFNLATVRLETCQSLERRHQTRLAYLEVRRKLRRARPLLLVVPGAQMPALVVAQGEATEVLEPVKCGEQWQAVLAVPSGDELQLQQAGRQAVGSQNERRGRCLAQGQGA